MISNVKLIKIKEESGKVTVKVYQVVHDWEEKLLAEHIFYLVNDKIAKFHLKG